MTEGQPGGQPEQAGATQQALDSPAAAAEASAEQREGAESCAAAAAAAGVSGGGASMGSDAGGSKTGHGRSGGTEGAPAAEDSTAMPQQADGGSAAAAAEPGASPGSSAADQPPSPMDAAPCTIMALPDHLICSCLEHVEQKDRLTSVALVCKRFASLSLCADERRIYLNIGGARAVERARQLLLWLPRNAPRIKYLGIDMAAPAGQPEGDQAAGAANPGPAAEAEIDNITACCLMAFGVLGGGQLEQLTVEPGTLLSTTAWLPTLRRLQRLQLGGPNTELLLTGPLHLLAEADDFQLTGAPIKFGPGVQLPPSLRHLLLNDRGTETMPPQVSALADLEELELQNCSYSASSMAGLSALHALTDLEFVACSAAPTELASMTQLHRLAVTRGGDAGAMPGIDAALSSLTRLTELWLAGSYASALPALPALSQLDSLAVLLPRPAPTATDDEVAPPAPPALPLGPWIGSLTELNVNWPLLANSVLALQQATSLEFVGVQSVPDPNDGPSESWDSAFDWLARHPPLRECRLCLDPLEDVLNFAAFDALMRLKDRRPSLLVGRVDAEFLPLE